MEALIRLAEEDQEIRRIATAAMARSSVQGVVLDLDAFWLTAWNYSRRFGSDGLKLASQQYDSLRSEYLWRIAGDELLEALPENRFPVTPLYGTDLSWPLPPDWQSFAAFRGLDPTRPPVRVTICLRPGAKEVPSIVSERYRILYETRPIATLSANPRRYRRPVVGGVSTGVGATIAGTLGGIVRGQEPPHQLYGVTCAHVMTAGTVDQPARADSRRAGTIGIVSAHTPLQLQTGACTPETSIGINTVDAALIAIDPATPAKMEVLDIGPLTGITPRANVLKGQFVELTGRTSGHRTLKVGGLGMLYELKDGGQTYCFKNIIQLSWPRFYQLGSGRPIARGDSGAWICNHDAAGFGWCGMIIGDDRLHGYAVYAQTIADWWQAQGLAVSVT